MIRNNKNISIKHVIRNPKVSSKSTKTINTTGKITGFFKFSQVMKFVFSSSLGDPLISVIRTTKERQKRRAEARSGIKPAFISSGFPIPNLILKKPIRIETPIKKRLLTRFNHFISVPYFAKFA